MLLKDFSFSQIASEASLEFGESVYTVAEDNATTMAYCAKPTQSSCSHYSHGPACHTIQSKTCSHYTSVEEQKIIMVAA